MKSLLALVILFAAQSFAFANPADKLRTCTVGELGDENYMQVVYYKDASIRFNIGELKSFKVPADRIQGVDNSLSINSLLVDLSSDQDGEWKPIVDALLVYNQVQNDLKLALLISLEGGFRTATLTCD
jgi:hypothetical protein